MLATTMVRAMTLARAVIAAPAIAGTLVVALARHQKLIVENLIPRAMLATIVIRAMTPAKTVIAALAITGTLAVVDAIVDAVAVDTAKMANQKLLMTMC
jgi:hypothetical protein